MENLMSFIPEQLFILIAAIYVMGMFLKEISFINDKYITILLMAFSIIFSVVLTEVKATSFLQGILCWGVAVGINQTFKQLNKSN